MIPKSGNRFPAFAKPASAGEGRSDEIMQQPRDQLPARAAGAAAAWIGSGCDGACSRAVVRTDGLRGAKRVKSQ